MSLRSNLIASSIMSHIYRVPGPDRTTVSSLFSLWKFSGISTSFPLTWKKIPETLKIFRVSRFRLLLGYATDVFLRLVWCFNFLFSPLKPGIRDCFFIFLGDWQGAVVVVGVDLGTWTEVFLNGDGRGNRMSLIDFFCFERVCVCVTDLGRGGCVNYFIGWWGKRRRGLEAGQHSRLCFFSLLSIKIFYFFRFFNFLLARFIWVGKGNWL